MQARKDFRSQLPNTEKRLLADVGAREEELRARLEKEGGSDGLAAWQVVAERGCKTSEAQYEEARKKWEEREKKSLPVEEDFSEVCSNLDSALRVKKRQARGREVRAYEEWRKERDEHGRSGCWLLGPCRSGS